MGELNDRLRLTIEARNTNLWRGFWMYYRMGRMEGYSPWRSWRWARAMVRILKDARKGIFYEGQMPKK